MTSIGVDVGGTFTDIIVQSEAGTLAFKVPSTPSEPAAGVTAGLEQSIDAFDTDSISFLSHGTTVSTNALLENDLAPVALVTTEGFRDALEIGRQDRPSLYDIEFERQDPVVPRDRRLTVDERIGPDGEVIRELDSAGVLEVAREIPDAVEAVAVSTLFSFRNPDHEREIGRLLEAEGIDDVVVSSDVLPEFREYERTSTTVINAALGPVVREYLDALRRETNELGIDKEWTIMQSNGGLMSIDKARAQPIRTLVSGPAAGVKGAQHLADRSGYVDVITMDMGGTSTDICVVEDGSPTTTTDREVSSHPVRVPSLDIHTIGAGGGSIAWIDAGGALRVGPKSAGARPGPACYGRGGTEPTVTDAHAVLNRIDPAHSLGGDLSVDVAAAREAIDRHVASRIDQSVTEAAQGILDVANTNTQRALRVASVEQGYDPRSFALVAYGGAGPLHAPTLAEEMSIPTVLVPRRAGVLSALGLLATRLNYFRVTSLVEPLDGLEDEELDAELRELVAEARGDLAGEGIADAEMSFDCSLEMRYAGQSFSLAVPLSGTSFAGEERERALSSFRDRHRERYGHVSTDAAVEVVNVRVNAYGDTEPVSLDRADAGATEDALVGSRDVWIDGEQFDCEVYAHENLPRDGGFDGPAIVQSAQSTVLVRPGQSVSVDPRGTLVVDTGVADGD